MKLKYEIIIIYAKTILQRALKLFYSKKKKKRLEQKERQKITDRLNRLKELKMK